MSEGIHYVAVLVVAFVLIVFSFHVIMNGFYTPSSTPPTPPSTLNYSGYQSQIRWVTFSSDTAYTATTNPVPVQTGINGTWLGCVESVNVSASNGKYTPANGPQLSKWLSREIGSPPSCFTGGTCKNNVSTSFEYQYNENATIEVCDSLANQFPSNALCIYPNTNAKILGGC